MTNEEAIKFLKQLYPNGGHCWLDEQRIEAIGIAIAALEQKGAASEDLEEVSDKYSKEIESNYLNDMFDRGDIMKAFMDGAQWQKEHIIKESVDAKITLFDGISYVSKDVLSQFKQGDKVKVIIVKES